MLLGKYCPFFAAILFCLTLSLGHGEESPVDLSTKFWGNTSALEGRLFLFEKKQPENTYTEILDFHVNGIDSILDDPVLRSKLSDKNQIADGVASLWDFTLGLYLRSDRLSKHSQVLRFVQENAITGDDVLKAFILYRIQNNLVASGKADLTPDVALLAVHKLTRDQFKIMALGFWDDRNLPYIASDFVSQRISPVANTFSEPGIAALLKAQEILNSDDRSDGPRLFDGKGEVLSEPRIWLGKIDRQAGLFLRDSQSREIKFIAVPDQSDFNEFVMPRPKGSIFSESKSYMARFWVKDCPGIDNVFLHKDGGRIFARFYSEAGGSYLSFDPRDARLQTVNLFELTPIRKTVTAIRLVGNQLDSAEAALKKSIRLRLIDIVTSKDTLMTKLLIAAALAEVQSGESGVIDKATRAAEKKQFQEADKAYTERERARTKRILDDVLSALLPADRQEIEDAVSKAIESEKH